MKIFSIRALLQSVLLMVMVSACQADSDSGQSHSVKQSFSIDDLYSYPSMIGTSPTQFSWSADGRNVAFLWNEEGHTYRDVWAFSTESGEKKRLTFHGDKELSKDEFNGISDVVWLDESAGRIAYVLRGKLYIADASGVEQPIETDKTRVKHLALSPDGKSFAFVARTEGADDEGDGLWVRATDTQAQARKVYADAQNSLSYIQSYQWSDDSRNLAFKITDIQHLPVREMHYYADNELKIRKVSRAFPGDETERFYVGVASIEGDSVRIFERPDAKHNIWNYGLSSDGDALFINSSDMLVKEHTVYVFDANTGERDVFYYEYDAKHLRPDWKVAWAPNDEGLIILTDRDGYLHLYHQTDKNAEPRALTTGAWEIASFKVDAAGGYIYFLANKAHTPERQLYRVAVTGGDVERVSDAVPGTHQPVFSPDMQYAATHFSSDFIPPDLYVIDLKGLETERVTNSPRPEFYEKTWANIGYVNFKSHTDGAPIIGRLSLPADYDPAKKYPLIVGSVYSDSVRNQWGGRTSHPTWGFDQYLVAQGYIVLNVNVRGSWGQGREHNQGLHHSYGGIDIEDIHSGVKHLIAEGYVDPDRVGIWGSSYGGLMTMMSLFKKQGVYAAGIAGAPATNVWHAYPGQMWVMGEPSGSDYPARYERQSAFYQAGGLEDPLMIIHGSDDDVVLYSDTIRVVERLIADEKMFELVTLPGTGHGWDNEDNATRRFSFKKMVAFFDRHLKPEQTVGQ